ncbi:aminoacyl-tRNA hydrolase [Candidatus Woesebacteria bacterium]|nr:aminoacyl-tRNA hydrolase [Candidatus Woesebacteria bacterium]
MKLIVGLGNPGKKYAKNRHNVGFMAVDKIAEELGVSGWELSKGGRTEYSWGRLGEEDFELFKPQTFMNESGFSLRYAKKKHQNLESADIYVIHDDLDIKLGEYKLQLGKGPKDHRGLESIDGTLGTSNYWHVRLGVDNRDSSNRIPGEKYVLQDFTKEEAVRVKEIVKRVAQELCKKLAT